MDTELTYIVKHKNIIVDATSLMCGQKDYLLLNLFDELRKNDKKVYVLSNTIDTLNEYLNYSEKARFAEDGLSVLEQFDKEKRIEYLNGDELINAVSRFNDVCVVTENKKKVIDIEKRTNNMSVVSYKICSGKLVKWDLYTNEEAKGNMSGEAKLIISIVIDNSASMKGDKIEKMKEAIRRFNNRINRENLSDKLQYSITIFRGFDSVCFKQFDQNLPEIDNLYAGGIPFVELTIKNSLDLIEKKVNEYEKSNITYYKPWMVLLLNGENYGDITDVSGRIVNTIKEGKMSFFPFALSDNEFNQNLTLLKKIKPFTVIKDEMYDRLFDWVFELAKTRVNTPINKSFSIDISSFDGWTIK